jgi:hypothetical protein
MANLTQKRVEALRNTDASQMEPGEWEELCDLTVECLKLKEKVEEIMPLFVHRPKYCPPKHPGRDCASSSCGLCISNYYRYKLGLPLKSEWVFKWSSCVGY